MISKELLSAVLSTVVDSIEVENNELEYWDPTANHNDGLWVDGLNIYELMHKCKKWAFPQGYTITSGTIPFGNNLAIVSYKLEGEVYRYKDDTEPKAVFKACQWILDNKEK